ncbi:MAG: DUF3097 family protein [Acidimicrobiales bacterium]
MPARRRDPGILSEPIDLDGPRRPRVTYPRVEALPGVVVQQRGTPSAGEIIEATAEAVLIRDRRGEEHWMRYAPGAFEVEGRFVTLIPPRARTAAPGATQRTASGSRAATSTQARVARASRILVEGMHDAELVEKVWGDDLRAEGVVVEQLAGADHLAAVVRAFGPGPRRRLGILLDHLVDGSKETSLAASVDHPDVLVVGHPYVDIWQAVKPEAAGITRWPDVAKGEPWKQGVLRQLGTTEEPGRFWKRLLASVQSWTDLEPALIGAVEQLIDFVTDPLPR